jgi:hypothetical protein
VTRARVRALLLASILLIVMAVAIAVARRPPAESATRPPADRPTLLLLTSLPLVFGENFSVDGGSPALSALETRYRVMPISVTDEADLAGGRLLLMAHPLAQPAEDLVALDAWVRGGGRLLLLADPALEWPSRRPLGDSLRPAPMFMDTGLLRHWGLRLDPPDTRGLQARTLGGQSIQAVSPGQLFGTCRIAADGFVADCRVGRGRAIVIADADFLNVDALGDSADHNLDALLAELADLRRS